MVADSSRGDAKAAAAEVAKKEAEAKAAAADEAKKAAEAAKNAADEEASLAAQAAALKAEQDAQDAKEQADAAVKAAAPEPEPGQPSDPDSAETTHNIAPDPHAKLRAEYRALTDEAREEEWIGFRVQVEQDAKRIRAQTSEIADLKAQVKELASGHDLGPTVTRLRAQIAAIKLKRDDAMTAAKSMEYRMKKAIKERDEAVRSMQAQEIHL